MAVLQVAKGYFEVALVLEVLAYHNKNYLDSYFCDNCNLSKEMQLLLLEAIKKIDEKNKTNYDFTINAILPHCR